MTISFVEFFRNMTTLLWLKSQFRMLVVFVTLFFFFYDVVQMVPIVTYANGRLYGCRDKKIEYRIFHRRI